MIRLSMNVISASISLIRFVDPEKGIPYLEIHSLYRIADIDVDDILEMFSICKLAYRQSDYIYLLPKGKGVLKSLNVNHEMCIRCLLTEYIIYTEPLWSKRIPYGRCEATTFMTKDEKSCFFESGLLKEEPDYDVVKWWDYIAEIIRKKKDDVNNETGRTGEQLTLVYEEKRVGKKPSWKSVDSNLLGYDIMSVVSDENRTPLLIEVKSSVDDIKNAYCHITSNEWQVAIRARRYLFYLWNIQKEVKSVAVVDTQDLFPYIPENKLSGEWESVKIPFISFKEKFIEWNGNI